MSKFNDFQKLKTAAETYLALGYAVIPLHGDRDPSRPKVAACSWSLYQRQPPTLAEVETWFSETGIGAALGIVTGRVSQLVVLDFDSAAAFTDFRCRYPDLLETRTVHSAGRNLPHLYFRLPSGLHIASQKVPGVDLLADGRYVVAPPSTLNGQPYTITRGGSPRTLTPRDIQRLNTFLSTYNRPTPNLTPSSVFLPPSFTGEGRGGGFPASQSIVEAYHPATSLFTPSPVATGYQRSEPANVLMWDGGGGSPPKTSRADLHALYTYWLTKGGRNDALFRTALHARDHGWNETQTCRALINLYTHTPISTVEAARSVPNSPRPEGYQQTEPANGSDVGLGVRVQNRQREASATIHSAFSRPPRTPKRTHQSNALSNTAREWLMQHRMTYVVRTFEGLLQTGFRAGQVFTAEQAINALKGIVGRDSVYNALNALAPTGKPLFKRKIPSTLPNASSEAAKIKSGLKTKKCFFVTEKKSGITKKGPKHRLYSMPANRDLCRLLRVKTSASDPLTRDDLHSARQTRMALHRELIKRRPAEYTRAWLAGRVGVSRRTLDTYNHLIPINRSATYITTRLSWSNIERLPLDEAQSGAFIETIQGKKYPALRSIAGHLLAKGMLIHHQQRKGNYYWYGSEERPAAHPLFALADDPAPPAALSPSFTVESRGGGSARPFQRANTLVSHADEARLIPTKPALSPSFTAEGRDGGSARPLQRANTLISHADEARLIPTKPALSPSPVRTAEGRDGGKSKSRYRKPLKNTAQETLAQQIYTRVNPSAAGDTRQLSLSNARRLVITYGEAQVRQALRLLESRRNLHNPTGFFVSVLRSSRINMESKK